MRRKNQHRPIEITYVDIAFSNGCVYRIYPKADKVYEIETYGTINGPVTLERFINMLEEAKEKS